jgi:hypothetical protein
MLQIESRAEDTVIEPLHVATVGGHPLRFFRTPLNDGLPDFPWHAVDDLHRCLGLNRDMRRFFLRKLKGAEWGKNVLTVATADGLISVAPNYMAQSTVDALVEDGMAPASARRDFDKASTEAMKKLDLPFTFPSDQWLDWMKAAMNRWESPR